MRRTWIRRWLPMLLALSACERGAPPPPPDFDSAATRARGRALYLEHCAICHGERSDGRGVRRSSLSASPANFRDPSWASRTTPQRTHRIIRDGIPGTPMPAWKAALNDGAIWDLTAYLTHVAAGAPEQP